MARNSNSQRGFDSLVFVASRSTGGLLRDTRVVVTAAQATRTFSTRCKLVRRRLPRRVSIIRLQWPCSSSHSLAGRTAKKTTRAFQDISGFRFGGTTTARSSRHLETTGGVQQSDASCFRAVFPIRILSGANSFTTSVGLRRVEETCMAGSVLPRGTQVAEETSAHWKLLSGAASARIGWGTIVSSWGVNSTLLHSFHDGVLHQSVRLPLLAP